MTTQQLVQGGPTVPAMYSGTEHARHAARLEVCREMLSDASITDSTVLDVGGGDGYAAGLTLPRTSRYVCLDRFPSAPTAAVRATASYAAAVAADGVELPVRSKSAGLVLCFEMLEHMHDPDAVVNEITRALEPDGVALIAVPVDSRLWRALLRLVQRTKRRLGRPAKPREHVQIFTRRDVRALLEREGLRVERVRACAFSVPFVGVSDVRRSRGSRFERVLSRVPVDNFGFVSGSRILAIGRQHLVVLARRYT
jgi:SAM-dependent methyltransferase